MVVKGLRGPSLPDEEIDEPSVRDHYLVGVLAPRPQHQDDAWQVARNFPNFSSSLTIPNCAGEQP